jgi:5'-nucleotidase
MTTQAAYTVAEMSSTYSPPATPQKPLRILVCNDDGIHAPGLFALKAAIERAGHEVTICAPHRPRSAASHAITMHKPLRLQEFTFPDGSKGYSASGTPADCATLGLAELMNNRADLVVSGINHGANLGWDVIYSGTVAAAMEASILGFPSIAVSIASYDETLHWDTAADFVAQTLIPKVVVNGLPPFTLLNVNAPNLPAESVRGVRLAIQGERHYIDRIEKRLDPSGRAYYWLSGHLLDGEPPVDADTRAVSEGYIAVTPIQLDMTAYAFMQNLREWAIER